MSVEEETLPNDGWRPARARLARFKRSGECTKVPMGYFDGLTANLFRGDSTCRRVYTSLGTRYGAFLVAAADAARITALWRRFLQVMLGTVLLADPGLNWRWAVLLPIPAYVGASLVLACNSTRGLQRIDKPALDPITRTETMRAFFRATGPMVLKFLFGVTLLFSGLTVWVVANAPTWQSLAVLAFVGFLAWSFWRQLRDLS